MKTITKLYFPKKTHFLLDRITTEENCCLRIYEQRHKKRPVLLSEIDVPKGYVGRALNEFILVAKTTLIVKCSDNRVIVTYHVGVL